MKMPGFTAEVSLYETSRQYCYVRNTLAQAKSEVIQSAIIHRCDECYRDDTGACVKNCETCVEKPGFEICNPDDGPTQCHPNQCPPPQPMCGPCTCPTQMTQQCTDWQGNIFTRNC
jgi:hypothetical protein